MLAPAPLRIVALRHALLEIRSASGTKFVHRFFEPGESYLPRTGLGWTVSAEDGSAFEWRSGDKSLGLLAPPGAVNMAPVDNALTGLQPIKLQVAPQEGRDAPANPNAPAPSASDLQAVRELRTKLEEADRKLADFQRRYSEQHPAVQASAGGCSVLVRHRAGMPPLRTQRPIAGANRLPAWL